MNLVVFDPCIIPNPTHRTLKKSKCLLSTLSPLPLSISSLLKLIYLSSCTNYQHQFRQDHDAETAPVPYDRHVFQSIFLDASNREFWTIDEIAPDKVIEKKWWHQLGHRWQHYARVVPGMMFINGKNQTWFAGSWTLVVRFPFAFPYFSFPLLSSPLDRGRRASTKTTKLTTHQNMHELALVSGIAAAYRLGADYVKFDDFAEEFFGNYMLVSHGFRYTAEEKRRKQKKQ